MKDIYNRCCKKCNKSPVEVFLISNCNMCRIYCLICISNKNQSILHLRCQFFTINLKTICMKTIKLILLTSILIPTWMYPVIKNQQLTIADPTIFEYKNTYYLYGTEPEPEYGFPVFVSKDLKNWQKPDKSNGYVLQKNNDTYGSWGFWAPQVLRHKGKFYMLYTANEQIAIAQSNSPLGPFKQTIVKALDDNTKQIDPYLFIDDNGKMYLYHVRLGGGNKIFVAEFNPDFSGINNETLTECITANEKWEDTKRIPAPPIAEGPTVFKRNGIYYMFYSANDFRNIDYAVGYATANSPMGPWKKYEKNPIINRELIGINGTGHGDLLQDKAGKFHYVFHAHSNDSIVIPRQTLIIDLKFIKNTRTGVEDIKAIRKSLRIPILQSSKNK